MITRLGFSRDAMDRISNHKDGRVRDVYDRHGYEREDTAIMAAVARHITGIVEGTAANNVVRTQVARGAASAESDRRADMPAGPATFASERAGTFGSAASLTTSRAGRRCP